MSEKRNENKASQRGTAIHFNRRQQEKRLLMLDMLH